jgi:hypothetical protein
MQALEGLNLRGVRHGVREQGGGRGRKREGGTLCLELFCQQLPTGACEDEAPAVSAEMRRLLAT